MIYVYNIIRYIDEDTKIGSCIRIRFEDLFEYFLYFFKYKKTFPSDSDKCEILSDNWEISHDFSEWVSE